MPAFVIKCQLSFMNYESANICKPAMTETSAVPAAFREGEQVGAP